jgi:hypothetical protein
VARVRLPGAAAQPYCGKYFERPALFRTEVTFSRRHSDCVRHRGNRGKSPSRLGQGKSMSWGLWVSC